MPRCYVESSNLVLLHILFRHGHRTPTKCCAYEGDPHKQSTYPPFGAGQLTNQGKVASYALGRYIKKEYGNFIGDFYTPGLVNPICTETDRAQTTLQLFLAALFPPVGELTWNKDLLWQPIPYKYYSRTNDKILNSCLENYDFEKIYVRHQNKIGTFDKHKQIFSLLSQKLGFRLTSLQDAWRFYMKLITQREYGLVLPEWTKSIFPKPLEDLAIEFYTTHMMVRQLRTIAISALVSKIILDTRSKLDSDGTDCATKLHIYSAHELNIAQMLIGMRSFIPPHMPNYCSCIIFEVRRYKGQALITVMYKRGANDTVEYLPLWGKNPCPLDEFTKLIHDANFK
ncbi:hypothetical protein Trydic_g1579 [Trypoxylus dichotomus]